MTCQTEAIAYRKAGLSLALITPNSKRPAMNNWNQLNVCNSIENIPDGYGIGLVHTHSGTMALDIDDWDNTLNTLLLAGINLVELCENSSIIVSGKKNRCKLIFKMPDGLILPTKKLTFEVDKKIRTFLEFRCATEEGTSVQDVLPPSIHPETGLPYQWAGKIHWTSLTVIPDCLLDYWKSLINEDNTIAQNTQPTEDINDISLLDIQSMLNVISPDIDRTNWIKIGMVLHLYGNINNKTNECLSMWNNWSSKGEKYKGEKEINSQWKSFNDNKNSTVRIGTLIKIAKDNNWVKPNINVEDMFKSNTTIVPNQLIQNFRPSPPNINLLLWPDILAQRAEEISTSVGCDCIVPLFAGLAAICGAVDSRIRLKIIDGFEVPPVLWLMTIGNPADKKTPGSKPLFNILNQLEIEDRPNFKKELLLWEGKEAMFASSKKAFLEFNSNPKAIVNPGDAPTVIDLPPQPVPLKLIVSDITSQKLVRYCADRPRGLLCYLDEMGDWVRKLTDKVTPEGRSSWVVGYEGNRYEMDRVGAGSIHCDNLAISIYGNIQPKVLELNINSLSSDGLIQRFIPAVLRESETKLGNPIPDYLTNDNQWNNLIRTIFALPETTYELTNESYDAFRQFQQWYEDTKRDFKLLYYSDIFMTAFGKVEGLLGRLILIFHIIESPFSITVDKEIVKKTITIMKTFIIPTYKYLLNDLSPDSSFDKWMADYIIQYSNKQSITLSEIRRSARRKTINISQWQADQMIITSMYLMESSNWVVKENEQSYNLDKTIRWFINPQLQIEFNDHRTAVINAKQRQLDEIYKLSTAERKVIKTH